MIDHLGRLRADVDGIVAALGRSGLTKPDAARPGWTLLALTR